MTTCPRCGAAVAPGATACGYCGTPVGPPAAQSPPYVQHQPLHGRPQRPTYTPLGAPPPTGRGSGGRGLSVVVGLVAALVVGAILAGGGLLLTQQSGDPSPTPTVAPGTVTASPMADFSSVYESVSSGVGKVQVTLCDGSAVGSAFLVAPDTMLTAYHVVEGASAISIDFDGAVTDATVVASNPQDDIAVLRLATPAEGAHVFALDSVVPTTGTRIAAIGFPLNSPKTLTEGTVSGKDREINVDGVTHSGLIQTDTAINPGNSGGPLVDLDGEVIGVADAGMLKAQGIGYVVPSATAAQYLSTSPTDQPLSICR